MNNVSDKIPLVSELKEWLMSERDLADQKASLCRRSLAIIDALDAGEASSVDMSALEAEIDALRALGVAQELILGSLLPGGELPHSEAAPAQPGHRGRPENHPHDAGSALDI